MVASSTMVATSPMLAGSGWDHFRSQHNVSQQRNCSQIPICSLVKTGIILENQHDGSDKPNANWFRIGSRHGSWLDFWHLNCI